MLRFGIVFAAGTALLAGCGASGQVGNPNVGVAPAGVHVMPAVRADKHADCTGTHGIGVKPCPVVLKKTKYVAVVATGPGVYESSWGPKPCQPFCKFSKVKINEFKIYPDKKCGTASVVIYAYNGADQLIGKAFFNVTNDECRH